MKKYLYLKCVVLLLLVSFSQVVKSQEYGDKEIEASAFFLVSFDHDTQRGVGVSYKTYITDWLHLSGNSGLWFMRHIDHNKIIPLTVGIGAGLGEFQYFLSAGSYVSLGKSKTHLGFGINPGITYSFFLDDHFKFFSKVSYHSLYFSDFKLNYLEMGIGLSYVIY